VSLEAGGGIPCRPNPAATLLVGYCDTMLSRCRNLPREPRLSTPVSFSKLSETEVDEDLAVGLRLDGLRICLDVVVLATDDAGQHSLI